MNLYDASINELFIRLCTYKPQPLELREYLREFMSKRELVERETLFKKNQPVTEALYVASGFVCCSGHDVVLGLSGKGSILADYSFTSGQPSEYELTALPGAYVLGVSFEHMGVIYERFPSTEELARLVMADVTRMERERILSLKREAELVVLDFYLDYPEFLKTDLMSDAEIASYLLIAESTLRNVRAKLIREEKFKDEF